MLLDLLPYAPLASVFLIIGLRLIFDKPNRPEFVYLRFKTDRRERPPKK